MIYGVAMGGVWGVASSLAMETIPDRSRGLMSGVFQAGYPFGYLLASVVFGLFYSLVGWRGMFLIGALPVLLLPFIYFKVPESPVWLAARERKETVALLPVLKSHWKLCVYLVLLMACFNFFSHGTQDLYPTYLKVQQGFAPHTISIIAIFYNIAAILGGILFGALSEKTGRKKAIIIAAFLALPVLPLWAFSSGSWAVGAGAFLMQFMVQGAWGVVPGWLTELVPAGARGSAGVCLSVRKSGGVGQRHAAVKNRHCQRQQLRAGDGDSGRYCGGVDLCDCRLWPGNAGGDYFGSVVTHPGVVSACLLEGAGRHRSTAPRSAAPYIQGQCGPRCEWPRQPAALPDSP